MSDLRNPITPWENELWEPEPFWLGRTVFCLASGPSMTPAVAERVRGLDTIVVNSTCYLAPWASILFFTDSGWFETGRASALWGKPGDDIWPRRAFVESWPGLVVSMSRSAKRVLPGKVKRIVGVGAPPFPPRQHGKPGFPPHSHVQQGRSSGHTAVALAIALGAARVVMLGYDMRVVGGREHHHDEYTGTPRDLGLYANEFAPGFAGWREAAEASGVDIVNATPGSAVTEFRFADLDDLLLERAA